MFIPICCLILGAAAMGRTKPQTQVRKMLCLGPRSGIVYTVEDFPEVGSLVVRAPNKAATALFIRANVREPGKPGLIYQHGAGDPRLLELVRRDFGVEPQKPTAAPKPAEEKPAEKAASA
jgi:hypothetical protein